LQAQVCLNFPFKVNNRNKLILFLVPFIYWWIYCLCSWIIGQWCGSRSSLQKIEIMSNIVYEIWFGIIIKVNIVVLFFAIILIDFIFQTT
jgi:hypothetical protein